MFRILEENASLTHKQTKRDRKKKACCNNCEDCFSAIFTLGGCCISDGWKWHGWAATRQKWCIQMKRDYLNLLFYSVSLCFWVICFSLRLSLVGLQWFPTSLVLCQNPEASSFVSGKHTKEYYGRGQKYDVESLWFWIARFFSVQVYNPIEYIVCKW